MTSACPPAPHVPSPPLQLCLSPSCPAVTAEVGVALEGFEFAASPVVTAERAALPRGTPSWEDHEQPYGLPAMGVTAPQRDVPC